MPYPQALPFFPHGSRQIGLIAANLQSLTRLVAMVDPTFAARRYEQAYIEVSLAAEVGEKVKAAREAAGLSQRELARRIGTSQSAINRLEAGGVGATLTTLQRVASALSLHISVELRPSA